MYFTTVPGNVRSLQLTFNANEDAFGSTTRLYTLDMTIAWEQPITLNGVITYEVTVAQTDNSSAIVYSNTGITVTSVGQSVMVLPYTNYTATVTASTSAGQGDPESVVEISPQAGKHPESLIPCL